MENSILAMIGIFISVAIMLSIGTQILGGAIQECKNLPGAGYAASASSTTADHHRPDNAITSADHYIASTNIGWAQQCEVNNSQTQSAYTLLIIIMIVIAAVAILSVVRML